MTLRGHRPLMTGTALLAAMAVALGILLSPTGAQTAPPAPAAAVPTPGPITGKGYKLVKNWDFGKTVTTREQMREEFFTRYIYENGKLDKLNDEWERYRDNDNHVFDGKSLKLTARVVGGLKDGGIESGMLRSKWTGKYGYFEARVKVPRGRGMWPAFWINPQAGWPPEIDVLEIVNNGRDTTRNSFHIVHGKATESATLETKLDRWSSYRPGFDFADDFHTFAVEWTPDTVTHFVDDVPVVKRRYLWRHDDGTDGGPAHVLINLAVGGKWPGPPEKESDFPAELAVQYIRVWQQ